VIACYGHMKVQRMVDIFERSLHARAICIISFENVPCVLVI
jgi:hypothetical protein